MTGPYRNPRAAELAARALREPKDQRRSVAQGRGALTQSVEQDEPTQPVRLRDRAPQDAKARRERSPSR
jgi:hypothetical protein